MSYGPSDTKKPFSEMLTSEELNRLELMLDELAEKNKLPREIVKHFVDRHIGESQTLIDYYNSFEKKLDPWTRAWMAEAQFAIDETCCLNLEDFYWRRSPLFLADSEHGLSHLEGIACVFAYNFHWNEEETENNKKNCKTAWIKRCLGVSLLTVFRLFF